MGKLICPSIMCADFGHLEQVVQELDQAGADIFHMDFMDGHFVPNFGLGLQDFEFVRKATKKLVDVHLMIQNPGRYVEKFADLGADIIYIHPEADIHPARALAVIRKKNKKAGLAINLGTALETVAELFPLIDYLMVMTVNPGFSGQKYLDYVDQKIERVIPYAQKHHFKVMVDGATARSQK